MGYFGIPFRNGVPIGLGSVVSFGAPQEFSPSELFPSGTAGAWYDPSDLSTLFTTSAGTTQCAMPGQGSAVSVGLMLDKSQGLVLGSELVTNGDFGGGGTGWVADASVSFTGGAAVFTASAGGAGIAQTLSVPAGAFICSFTVSGASGGGLTFRIRTAGGTIHATFSTENTALNKTYSFVLFPASASNRLEILSPGGIASPTTLTLDNVTIKALPGNHAIAFNDTTARPELRARVNLLVATTTLSTQSVTTQATSYTLSFAGTGSITLSGTATGSYSAGTHTITCTAGTLTLTVSGTVTTADLRPANSGALLPAYQAVVDANTYDTSGFPLYLRFDGIDDSMYTPANLNLSGTDKVAVFAGVRKNADAASGQAFTELSSSFGSNNGSFGLLDVGAPNYTPGFGSRGTATAYPYPASGYSAPLSMVLTGIGNIAAPLAQIRANGSVAASSTASQGTGNYGTYPLYIGDRNSTSLRFNGHLHSLIIAGSAVSAGNISATEQWVANKTGIVIP